MSILITTVETGNPEATLRLGSSIGHKAVANTLVVLDGDLGTGKTVFARGIAEGLGIKEWRGSPTFTLVHEYFGRLPFFHIDAYRITAQELIDLDFAAVLSTGGVVAVEWGKKMLLEMQSFEPSKIIQVRLTDGGDDVRHIEIER